MKWTNSNRRNELPPDWRRRREVVIRREGGQCQAMSQITDWGTILHDGVRCERPGVEVNHTYRANHDPRSLELLCAAHHRIETQRQSAEARARMKAPKLPAEPHPRDYL